MKRAALILCTVLALFSQGVVWAVAAPQTAAMQMAMGDDGMPCCDQHCDCLDLCASPAPAMAPVFSMPAIPVVAFQPVVAAALRLGSTHYECLRPPIALQS